MNIDKINELVSIVQNRQARKIFHDVDTNRNNISKACDAIDSLEMLHKEGLPLEQFQVLMIGILEATYYLGYEAGRRRARK